MAGNSPEKNIKVQGAEMMAAADSIAALEFQERRVYGVSRSEGYFQTVNKVTSHEIDGISKDMAELARRVENFTRKAKEEFERTDSAIAETMGE